MSEIIELRAMLEFSGEEGTALARLVPYGHAIEHGGARFEFAQGSITVPDSVPVNIDHGPGALERIGLALEFADKADGLYATLKISDTAAGRDTLTLLRDGVLTDVSAGIAMESFEVPSSGVLDHVAVTGRGAFGEAGSKVLATYTKEGAPMGETDTAPIEGIEETQREMIAEMADLKLQVSELAEGHKVEARPFADVRDFVLTLAKASRGERDAIDKMAEFVLADDTTTTSAGVVPDYLATRVIEIIDTSRPYLQTLRQDPIGDHGMSVVYPKVVSGPSVAVQSAEKAEVDSTAMDIDPVSYPLLTYAGASDVSRQLIERSQPSFVDILFRHYANAYAQATDGDAAAAALTAITQSAVLADLGASAAATFAAVNVANAAIITAVRKPATHWALSATRWSELNSLADSDGRPILVFPDNGPMNAQGQSSFVSTVAQYHGLIAYLDPNMTADTDFLYNAEEFAFFLESATQQLRAEVVSLLGFDMGVYGLFAHAVEQAGAGYKFTQV
jgi:HK97 family phage major capsid protein